MNPITESGRASDASDAAPLDAAISEGRRRLDAREFDAAAAVLEPVAARDADGESRALLALACFQRQQYEAAAHHYEGALRHAPDHAEWREMQAIARANAVSEMNVHVPDVRYFDRETLLAPRPVERGTLPAPPPAPPAPG